jgi:hypothetical protein
LQSVVTTAGNVGGTHVLAHHARSESLDVST